MKKSTAGDDRLSDLPEDLIHHIMSFLSLAEAVKISILSKKFYSVWRSFPVLEFDSSHFLNNSSSKEDAFLGFVCSTLERCRAAETTLDSLSYYHNMVFLGFHSHASRFREVRFAAEVLEKLANFAMEKKIRHLSINCGNGFDIFRIDPILTSIRCFPNSIFSSHTIKTLKLRGLRLESKVLILTCPLIEEFSLSDCIGLASVEIANCVRHIKDIALLSCHGLERIQIHDGPASLRSLSYSGRHCDAYINQASAKSLKCLKLCGVSFTNEWLQDKVSKFASLETLVLKSCTITEDLCIGKESLKCLEIEFCDILLGDTVDISVSGLESLRYSTAPIPYWRQPLKINIRGSCRRLKSLSLGNITVTERWVKDNLLGLRSCLEDLKFKSCDFKMSNNNATMKFSFEKLKSFELHSCPYDRHDTTRLPAFVIETPSLDFLCCRGKIALTSLVPASSKLNNVDLRLEDNWFADFRENLRGCLSCFAHCHTLFLSISHPKDLVYPKNVRDSLVPPLHGIKHLKVQVGHKPTSIVDFIDTLLWLAPHPEIVTFIDDSYSTLPKREPLRIKFYYDKDHSEIKEEEDNIICCSMSPVKCWRHDLSKVEIENTNGSGLKSYFLANAKLKLFLSEKTSSLTKLI